MPRNTPSRRKSGVPPLPGITDKKLLTAYAVALRYLRRSYVTGVGIGYAMEDETFTQELALCIHVREKRPIDALTKAQVLPRRLKGVRVDVVRRSFVQQMTSSEYEARQKTRQDPLRPGALLKTDKSGAGTIGLLVKGMKDGQRYILTAGHVLDGGARNVYQPMRSVAPTPVGTVAGQVHQLVDAGLVGYDGRAAENRPIASSVRITSLRVPGLNDTLTVSGAYSGATAGWVSWIGTSAVGIGSGTDHHGGDVSHIKVLGFVVHPLDAASGVLTQKGDSGALWFDAETGAAVGLHVGSHVDEHGHICALACDMTAVMDRLRVTL